jgi:hypothetical protein
MPSHIKPTRMSYAPINPPPLPTHQLRCGGAAPPDLYIYRHHRTAGNLLYFITIIYMYILYLTTPHTYTSHPHLTPPPYTHTLHPHLTPTPYTLHLTPTLYTHTLHQHLTPTRYTHTLHQHLTPTRYTLYVTPTRYTHLGLHSCRPAGLGSHAVPAVHTAEEGIFILIY